MPFPALPRLVTLALALLTLHVGGVPTLMAATGVPDFAQPITINPDGTLTYVPNSRGDMVPDFSAVGWRNGDEPLPGQPGGITVPVVETLEPGSGDQSGRIQAAIWRVAQRPLDSNGFRGAILLKAGLWEIRRTLLIDQSGIVLRGEGNNPNGVCTHLYASMITNDGYTGASQGTSMIRVRGNFDDTPRYSAGDGNLPANSTSFDIVGRVPVGAKSVTIATTPDFRVGELVRIFRPITQAWYDAELLADRTSDYVNPGNGQTAHRRVVRIDGNTIHLNAPITYAIDPVWGGGKVLKVTAEGYIRNVGIEDIYASSYHANATDQNHAWNVVSMERIEDGYVRDVTARYFAYALCYITTTARQITVERCQMIDPTSWVTNALHENGRVITDAGGNRYAYLNNGELTLVRDSYSRHSRHEFPTSWFLSSGPAAFVDCLGENGHNESGAHIYWTTGTLWDNVTMRSLQNKRERPTGNTVSWNCIFYGGPTIIENAVTAVNWSLGSTNLAGNAITYSASTGTPRNQGGEIFSNGTRMSVRSLHEAQVAARRAEQGRAYTPRTTHNRPSLQPIVPVVTAHDATGKVGQAFSYQIRAFPMPVRLNGGTYYTATGLPPGLSITSGSNKSFGYITGTPTTAGSYIVTLGAVNQDGASTPTPVTFTILDSTSTQTFPLDLTLEAEYPDSNKYGPLEIVPFTANYDKNGDLDFVNNDTNPILDEVGVVVPVRVVPSHQFPALRIPFTVTYNGSTTLPSTAGSYSVVATSTNPLYPGSITRTLTIKSSASITLTGLTKAYTGQPLTPSYTTSPAGLAVEFVYETPQGTTTTPPTMPGAYAVRGIITDPLYAGSTLSNGTTNRLFTITKMNGSITLGNLSQAYTGAARQPSATTNPTGLTVTYVYTQNGVAVEPVEPGTYNVTATIDSPLYTGTRTATLTITKAAATVQLTGTTKVYDGTALVPTVTTVPPGLVVDLVYARGSAPVGVADSGSVTATVNDPRYTGATSASLSITKAVATVSIDAGTLAQVYDGTPRVVTATTVPPGLTTTLRYGTSTTAPTTAGSYSVVAQVASTEPNYTGTSATATLVVAKAPVTVTLANLTQDFTGTARPVTATTVPADQPVTLTYAGSATAPTTAGTYAVTGTVNTTNGTGTASGTLTIRPVITSPALAQANVGFAFTWPVQTLGSPTDITATGLPAGLTIASTGVISGTPTTVGDYPVTVQATRAGATGTQSLLISVLPADQRMAWTTPASIVYGTALGTTQLNATTSVAGTMTYDPPAGTVLTAGTHVLTATFTPDDAVAYRTVSTSVTLTVTPAPLQVAGPTVSRTYGDANPALAAVVTGLVGSDSLAALTVTTTATATSPVGSYPVIPSVPSFATGSASNYTITRVNGTLSVTPAPLTITAAPATRAFGTLNPPFGLAPVVGLKNSDQVTGAVTVSAAALGSAVGTYPITSSNATFRTGSASNYQITYVPGVLTVTPAPLTISLPRTLYRLQGAANPSATANATGLRAGNALAGVDIAFPATDVAPGTYPLALSNALLSPGAISNYTVTYTPGSLVVLDPASVTQPTITWTPEATLVYGTALDARHLNAQAGGVAGTMAYDPPLGTVLAAGTNRVLTVTFTPTDLVLYAPVSVSRNVTVTPAPLNIRVATTTRRYGAGNPTVSPTIIGLVGSDQVEVTVGTTATATTPVGLLTGALVPSTPIFTSGTAENYTITSTAGDLQITPAPLTVQASNASRQIGTDNPAFTVTVTGLVNGEQVQEPLTASTPATTDSPVGSYPITPATPVFATGSASNYAITVVPGILTVTPIMPAITLSGTVTGTQGTALSIAVTTTGGPTRYQASNLPPGLAIDGRTGVISGTPTSLGLYVVTLLVSNNVGADEGSLMIVVVPPDSPVASDGTPGNAPAGCGSGTALALLGSLALLALGGRRRRA